MKTELWIKNIQKSKIFNAGKQTALVGYYQRTKDRKVLDLILRSNSRFVLRMALGYRYYSVPISDLTSEGMIGMTHAIEKYDVSRGLNFLTYAVWWVKAYMQRYILSDSTIHIPHNKKKKVQKALKLNMLEEDDHRVFNLTNVLNIETNDYELPIREMDMSHLDNGKILEIVKSELSDMDYFIVTSYFGFDGYGLNLREIGERLGITKERVRQRIKKSMQHLRTAIQMSKNNFDISQ